MEHSLDAGQSFSTAGHIHLEEGDAVSGIFERDPISSTQLSRLQQLVESDRLYLWRVTLPDQPPVLTSIKAACLAPALTSAAYALHIDAAGHIMSAQISVPSAALPPGGSCSTSHALQALQRLSAADLSGVKTVDVAVHTARAGPAVPKPPEAATPDLSAAAGAAQQAQQKQAQQRQQQAAQQRRQQGGSAGGKDGAEGAEGEAAPPPVDDRTWLQKNWLIVLAGSMMVVNILMKGVVDPQAAGGGGPGGRPPQPQRRAIE